MDKISTAARSKIMSRIRGKETKQEVMVAKALWHRGYRYRKNNRTVKGTPDLTFKRIKLAIFIDGDFWHGRDWERKKGTIKTNQAFWEQKIERNIERDREVNAFLKMQRWTVLRFWASDVTKNLEMVLGKIEKTIVMLKTNKYRQSDDLRMAADAQLKYRTKL